VAELRAQGDDALAPSSSELDLLDPDAVRATVGDLRPDQIFHLAALASVRRSWEDPRGTLLRNLEMTVNLLEAVRLEQPGASVLLASSSEVYGPPARLPVTESDPVRPQNPYAVSKAACELVGAQQADARGLRVVRTRAFNHAGPGQSDVYVVASLTRQVAEAEADGGDAVVLRTGNIDVSRDFTDVRDVVRAYTAAVGLDPGVYNVCSGRSISIREVIETLRANARIEVRHEVDPDRLRPHDVQEIRGSARLLEEATGWRPRIDFDRTVADALADWRLRLGVAR
jgi:GDP-4-dehydro-6-deoxy-D-mannose reductase